MHGGQSTGSLLPSLPSAWLFLLLLAAVRKAKKEINTISLFKPKQTHSALPIQYASVERREMSGEKGRRCGVGAPGLAPLAFSTPSCGIRRSLWTAPNPGSPSAPPRNAKHSRQPTRGRGWCGRRLSVRCWGGVLNACVRGSSLARGGGSSVFVLQFSRLPAPQRRG